MTIRLQRISGGLQKLRVKNLKSSKTFFKNVIILGQNNTKIVSIVGTYHKISVLIKIDNLLIIDIVTSVLAARYNSVFKINILKN